MSIVVEKTDWWKPPMKTGEMREVVTCKPYELDGRLWTIGQCAKATGLLVCVERRSEGQWALSVYRPPKPKVR